MSKPVGFLVVVGCIVAVALGPIAIAIFFVALYVLGSIFEKGNK